MQPVIIVGAGPAGLTASYELSKLGKTSTLLEADRQVGGLSRTVSHRGFRFDIGGHRFFTKIPYVQSLWEEILGGDFLLRPRLSRIHYDGKFFDYPLRLGNALRNLGPLEALRVGLSYARSRLRTGGEDQSFEQWVSRRFGDRLYRMFFKTYTEKVWGIPCREISADWAAQRIQNLSLGAALREALSTGRPSSKDKLIPTLIDEFHYPRLGPGMMWEQCQRLLSGQGIRLHRGIRVNCIRHEGGRVDRVSGIGPGGGTVEFRARQFISTMPLRELIQALQPRPPSAVLKAAAGLRYRDYLTVVLIVRKEHVFPDNWIYIHSPDVKMGRIQNYKRWSPEMVPDPSRTSLGLEYFLWEGDPEWQWPDSRLIELGVRECSRIGLVEPEDVEDAVVVRMKKAYPVYDREYRWNLSVLRRYLRTFSNLQTIGRNGLHRYNNQDHSMLTGIYAARNLCGEELDVWRVNTEREYHEEGRRNGGPPGLERLVPRPISDAASGRKP